MHILTGGKSTGLYKKTIQSINPYNILIIHNNLLLSVVSVQNKCTSQRKYQSVRPGCFSMPKMQVPEFKNLNLAGTSLDGSGM